MGKALYYAYFTPKIGYDIPIPNIAEEMGMKPEKVMELINAYLRTEKPEVKKRIDMLQRVSLKGPTSTKWMSD